MMLGATTRQSLLGGGAGFLEHIPAFSGDLWYVNGTTGNDANSGRSPEVPFATIGAALAVALAGDAITVAPGDYDEVGLDLAPSLVIIVESAEPTLRRQARLGPPSQGTTPGSLIVRPRALLRHMT
jgi:hypothetical protein